jgi:flagellar motor switch protein FliG
MGNIMRHGADLYKQTVNLKNNPPPPIQETQPVFIRKTRNDGVSVGISAPKTNKAGAGVGAGTPGSDGVSDSKFRRVAKFLILIGSEQASEILASLDPDQVEEISKEIAKIKTIKPEEGEKILEEFHTLFSKPYIFSGKTRGGVEAARRILYAAKGPEKGEEILNKAIPASKGNLFGFLEEFSADQLVMLLKPESPQTVALILSRLTPKLSAETINKLPSDIKPEVLRRIAYQKEISPEVLEQVTAGLREKARNTSGGAGDVEIDGMQTLAAILKQGDYDFGDKIINELEQSSPDIGKTLKEKIYTLDDVVYTVDRPIQDKLSLMSDQEIAILMKGRGKPFCEKILSCVSAGRRKLIREEFEVLGAVPKRDCDAAAGEFLSWFRKARENGDIILYSDKDVFL